MLVGGGLNTVRHLYSVLTCIKPSLYLRTVGLIDWDGHDHLLLVGTLSYVRQYMMNKRIL